jgi:uncharacterized UBP type Zn finger protein
MMDKHLDQIKKGVQPSGDGCVECLRDGTPWVALRECLTCGHVGCCDSSIGKHATAHFKETGHAIMQAYKEDKAWRWCYIDEAMV